MDDAFEQPRAAATAMIGFGHPWCIAGGWAIDLMAGRATREHKDVEIAVFRKDQHLLRSFLQDWDFFIAINQQFVSWPQEQTLSLPQHELYATSPAGAKLEFLLNERDAIDWIYRREFSVRRPIEKAIRRGREGIPVLASEIVLLYKSKTPRPQDELDFRVAREMLDDESRRWLIDALRTTAPPHPWLKI